MKTHILLDALLAMGFARVGTGGGCEALQTTNPRTDALLVVTDSDAGVPDDGQPVVLGIYANEDEWYGGGGVTTIYSPAEYRAFFAAIIAALY